jgi:Mg-chelatase subunit ChlD
MVLMLGQVGSLFTAPWLAGAGAAAVSIPIAIHLLSRFRRKQQPWGAMRFLLAAYRRHKRRLRMEQWLLLLVRCLLVLMLGLALAGPLMGGFVGQWAGGVNPQGRVVHLILEDGLSTRAEAVGQAEATNRFASLKRQARTLIDGLGPRDRVALWRASRPSEAVVGSPTAEHAKVRRALETMRPRFSRSDMSGALTSVADRLTEAQVQPQRGLVVVLSDFARGAGYLRRPPRQTQQRLAAHARLAVTSPAPGASNAQVQRLTAGRGLVLARPGESAQVAVSATLRRFGAASEPARRDLEIELFDLAGNRLARQRQPVTWQPGQATSTANLTLTTDRGEPTGGEGGRAWQVRARLSEAAGTDRLRADDTAWASTEVRANLDVGLVGANGPASGEGLAPGQWLRLALRPSGVAGGGAMRLRDIEPDRVGGADEPLAAVDAAFVLDPRRVTPGGWSALSEFARAGGLVWVIAPPREAAAWVEPMRQGLGLTWRINLDPAAAEDGRTRRLNTDRPVPEPLARLAADWPALLQPIRIQRWLGMDVPAAQRWLVLDSEGDGAGQTVLAGAELGAGRVLVQTLPLHPAWTNLPTKPALVPLLHETLRRTIGPPRRFIVAGDRPTLEPRWAGIDRLVPITVDRPADGGDAAADQAEDAPAGVALSDDASPRVATALRQPGVYRAAESGQALAVNVDPAAGDLRTTARPQVASWFDRLAGERWTFLPADEPAAILKRAAQRASLGWPLLWAVLALAVAELLLARHFAHAQRTDQPRLRQRIIGLWRHLRHADHPPTPGRGR